MLPLVLLKAAQGHHVVSRLFSSTFLFFSTHRRRLITPPLFLRAACGAEKWRNIQWTFDSM